MSLITRQAKENRSMTVNKCHKIYLSGSFGIFSFTSSLSSLTVAGANNFITDRFLAAPVQANRDFFSGILTVQFLKQGPAYKKEGPDPNEGSNQQ